MGYPARSGQVDTVVRLARYTQVGMDVIMVMVVMVFTFIVVIFFVLRYFQ